MKTIDDWARIRGLYVVTPEILCDGFFAILSPGADLTKGQSAPKGMDGPSVLKAIRKEVMHEMRELPKLLLPTGACRFCDGIKTMELCERCAGDGVKTCSSCGHEYECRDCDGNGVLFGKDLPLICNKCVGSGLDLNELVKVGGAWVNLKYWVMLNALPNVKIETPESYVEGSGGLVFEFDGGRGVVMPRRHPLERGK